jgi:hypothetical protein
MSENEQLVSEESRKIARSSAHLSSQTNLVDGPSCVDDSVKHSAGKLQCEKKMRKH